MLKPLNAQGAQTKNDEGKFQEQSFDSVKHVEESKKQDSAVKLLRQKKNGGL